MTIHFYAALCCAAMLIVISNLVPRSEDGRTEDEAQVHSHSGTPEQGTGVRAMELGVLFICLLLLCIVPIVIIIIIITEQSESESRLGLKS